jgi:hypothetical protein
MLKKGIAVSVLRMSSGFVQRNDNNPQDQDQLESGHCESECAIDA